mmetsp:Transcript_100062/g.311782  ORF Transcript_100062/g.311782 Transcript_100062/m.311782 type:complete len:221 (-) Transcript_100062:196-858(-)
MLPKTAPSAATSCASKRPEGCSSRAPVNLPPAGFGPSKRSCPSGPASMRYSLGLLPYSQRPTRSEGSGGAAGSGGGAAADDEAPSEPPPAWACQWLRFASFTSRSFSPCRAWRSLQASAFLCCSSSCCWRSSSRCFFSSSLRCARWNLGSDSRSSFSTKAKRADCMSLFSAEPSVPPLLPRMISRASARFCSCRFFTSRSSASLMRRVSLAAASLAGRIR